MSDANKGPIASSFTATGVSGHVLKGKGQGDLSLAGTWVGTVEIQRKKLSGWEMVKSYTANAEESIANGADNVLYRLECTAFTSGEIEYELKA